MMKIYKYKLILKERWKFYLIGYLIGYFVPIILYGAPSWQYLMPIRIMGIACAPAIGSAIYYGLKKASIIDGVRRSLKYVVFMVVLILCTFILKELILSIWGFDITPYIGMPSLTK